VIVQRDRLLFRLFRIVEGEAEGRFAIVALALMVLAVLLGWVSIFAHQS
jgi:hypothetical protein